jgi:hypothetical protein
MLWVLALPSAIAGDGGWAAAPFGVGLFVHERPVRGSVYAVTQVAGITGAVLGSLESTDAYLANDADRVDRAQALTAVSVAAAGLSYAISLVDGSRVHQVNCAEAEARRQGLELWDRGLAMREISP